MTTPADAWAGLNDRQRTYLRALFDQDQGLEEEHRRLGARGVFDRAPARVWRRIAFNDAHSPIPGRLRAAGVYDSGAGATLAALRDRGLIETDTEPGLFSDLVSVWLTRAGRAAVRAHDGSPARVSRPRWALSEWLWREMARVVGAGEQGLLSTELASTAHLYLDAGHASRRGNRPYLRSTRRHVPVTLRVNGIGPAYNSSRPEYRYHLTDEGRAHYADHMDAYRQLYPAVDAPDLPVPTA